MLLIKYAYTEAKMHAHVIRPCASLRKHLLKHENKEKAEIRFWAHSKNFQRIQPWCFQKKTSRLSVKNFQENKNEQAHVYVMQSNKNIYEYNGPEVDITGRIGALRRNTPCVMHWRSMSPPARISSVIFWPCSRGRFVTMCETAPRSIVACPHSVKRTLLHCWKEHISDK